MIRILFASFFCGLVACSDKIEVPKGILPPKQMQKVMWEMIKADELVNLQSQKDTTLQRLPKSIALYQTIFKEYHTSDSQFKTSFKYYEKHPDIMKVVLDSLEAQSTRKPADSTVTPRQATP